jgi:hypothetical protein
MSVFWLRLIFDTALAVMFAVRIWPQMAWHILHGARKRRIRFEP